MNNSNAEPRFDGDTDRSDLAGSALPQHIRDRLNRLREASGLNWGALARAINVDRKRARRWRRKGVKPSGQIGGK